MVIAWAAWFGIYLLIQAIYIWKRGIVAPFFFARRGASSLSALSKLMLGLIHFVPGVWLVALVGRSMWHTRGSTSGGDIVLAAAMIAVGIAALIRPIIPLDWAKRAHPDLPLDNAFLLAMTRVIGGVLLFMGLVFLVNP